MENKTCFRCGDVLMYCKCVQELFEERSKLMAMGIDPDGLESWEVQLPTYLELEKAGKPPEERAFWVARYQAARADRG